MSLKQFAIIYCPGMTGEMLHLIQQQLASTLKERDVDILVTSMPMNFLSKDYLKDFIKQIQKMLNNET